MTLPTGSLHNFAWESMLKCSNQLLPAATVMPIQDELENGGAV